MSLGFPAAQVTEIIRKATKKEGAEGDDEKNKDDRKQLAGPPS